tara:strand:- start:2287 stop:2871 length:585 start_codon:yes stop_codon:yes gene_type:complete
MGIDWGVPAQRATKMEKFLTPVVTMSAFAGKGSGRKLTFNKAAVDSLRLVKPEDGKQSFVTFGRDTTTSEIVLVASLTENESMKFFKVNKSFSFSDKKTYEFIAYTLKLDTSVENYLHIESVEGEPYFKVANTTTVDTTIEEINTEEELNIPIVEEEEEPVLLEPVTSSTQNPEESIMVSDTSEEVEETVTDEW